MPIPDKNSKGEQVLSISRSMMTRKKTIKIQTHPCVCSVCGEKAKVQPKTVHNYCRGMKLDPITKVKLPSLHKPNKGMWEPEQAPIQATE